MQLSNYFNRLTHCLIIMLLLGFFVMSVYADMQLVSSYPADGETSINNFIDLQLTFNNPIDTTHSLEDDEDEFCFISTWFHPSADIGEPENILFSEDLKTVTFQNLFLADQTQYNLLILGIYNTAGEMLDKPYHLHFSTGDHLPETTVSGTVLFQGDTQNFMVILFEQNDSGSSFISSINVDSSDGRYTIPYCPDGDFMVAAIKDNGDGVIDPSQDVFALYDADQDQTPDQITIQGENLTHIDIQVLSMQSVSARELISKVYATAKMQYSDNQLIAVSSEETQVVGNPLDWYYWFWSETADRVNIIPVMGGNIMPADSYFANGTQYSSIDTNWVDSDSAFAVAQRHGGEAFQNQYPGLYFQYILANATSIVNLINDDIGKNLYKQTLSKRIPLQKEMVGSETSVWIISYEVDESDASLIRIVNALTADFIPPTTVRFNLNAAENAMSEIDEKAELIYVSCENLEMDGLSYRWIYIYAYPDEGHMYQLSSFADTVLQTREITVGDDMLKPDLKPLPELWIDSDSVIVITKPLGGEQFKNDHPDCHIDVCLATSNHNQFPEWHVYYCSETDELPFWIDARTGYLSSIEDPSNVSNQTFALYQNYPNPFNAQTSIRFHLPEKLAIKLILYNVKGEQIDLLVNAMLNQGEHCVHFDTSGLPSGIYLYQLKTDHFCLTKKCLLIR